MFNDSFWSNSLSNLLATVIGIIIGLPIALWLNRLGRKRDERQKQQEKNQRTIKILTLLESELNDNREMMSRFHKDVANNFFPVRTESWKAFSDGGELQWLDDPEVIHQLSIAYARIEQFKFMFDKYVTAFYFPGSMGDRNLQDILLGSTLKARDTAITQSKISQNFVTAKLKSMQAQNTTTGKE